MWTFSKAVSAQRTHMYHVETTICTQGTCTRICWNNYGITLTDECFLSVLVSLLLILISKRTTLCWTNGITGFDAEACWPLSGPLFSPPNPLYSHCILLWGQGWPDRRKVLIGAVGSFRQFPASWQKKFSSDAISAIEIMLWGGIGGRDFGVLSDASVPSSATEIKIFRMNKAQECHTQVRNADCSIEHR